MLRAKELQPLIDEVQRKYWAKNEAANEYDKAEAALKKAVGPGHVFTNEVCRANKIGGHIYDNPHVYPGVGRRHCILCGADDFDF